MTPLVLIPGMMCDHRMWGGFTTASRILIHALPIDHDTVQALASEILRAAPPRFALAGLSMGGIVAMEIVAQAPHRVERLALLDTNPRAETPEAQSLRTPQIAKALAGGLEAVLREEMKPNYLAPGPKQKPILDLCMEMALTLGPEVFALQSAALRDRPDQTATLAAYKGPTLILMGEEDCLCPRDRHEQMHALMPQSSFVIVRGAAHIPTLEASEITFAHMREWLASPA